MSGLFQTGNFALHSGAWSNWKVECDSLTEEDWRTLAAMIADRVSFGRVEGVPRGGLPLARVLQPYREPGDPTLLIVDDVLTTGGSMEEHRAGRDAVGYVVFNRRDRQRSVPFPKDWVRALWTLDGPT